MDFEIEQSRFLSALTLAQTVADKRATMPMLANVLLRADAASHQLICSATDTSLSLVESVPCKVHAAGSLTISVKNLQSVVRTLPEDNVRVTGQDNSWAKISCRRIEFRLMGMPETDFPSLPEPRGLTFDKVPAHVLADLVQKTLFSVSTDEARVNLNGALFECDHASAAMVSTDGHRLTKIVLPFAGPDLRGRSGSVIIPRKGLLELRKVLDRVGGDVELAVGDQYMFVRSESALLSIKLNATSFPPYAQVIPREHKRLAIVGRQELLDGLRRAVLTASEKSSMVRFDLGNDQIELSAGNPDAGQFRQDISAEITGDALTAGFNGQYFIEALEAIDSERVELHFQGELDPCVVRPSEGVDFLAVVMPMRI